MTTALILLPLAAALVVWLLPLPGRVSGVIALLAALAEVALWVVAAAGFDFGQGLRFRPRGWFSDLGVSYHVGFYGFSLWLAGLTVVVSHRGDRLCAVGHIGSVAARIRACCSS